MVAQSLQVRRFVLSFRKQVSYQFSLITALERDVCVTMMLLIWLHICKGLRI